MSHFLHSLLLDKLYAKGVYFCSFVTKSNQACTKYSARCIQPFHRTVIHGEYHKIFASTTPFKQVFHTIHYKTYSLCCLPIFCSLFPSEPSPKDKQDFSRFWKTHSYVIFLLQRKFFLLKIAPLFSHTLTPPQTYMQYQQALLLKWN